MIKDPARCRIHLEEHNGYAVSPHCFISHICRRGWYPQNSLCQHHLPAAWQGLVRNNFYTSLFLFFPNSLSSLSSPPTLLPILSPHAFSTFFRSSILSLSLSLISFPFLFIIIYISFCNLPSFSSLHLVEGKAKFFNYGSQVLVQDKTPLPPPPSLTRQHYLHLPPSPLSCQARPFSFCFYLPFPFFNTVLRLFLLSNTRLFHDAMGPPITGLSTSWPHDPLPD